MNTSLTGRVEGSRSKLPKGWTSHPPSITNYLTNSPLPRSCPYKNTLFLQTCLPAHVVATFTRWSPSLPRRLTSLRRWPTRARSWWRSMVRRLVPATAEPATSRSRPPARLPAARLQGSATTALARPCSPALGCATALIELPTVDCPGGGRLHRDVVRPVPADRADLHETRRGDAGGLLRQGGR